MARSSTPSPELFSKAGFEAFIKTLPAATLVVQWGDAAVAKVGGKIFAILNSDGSGLSFKCSELAFAMLPELAGIAHAPYLARAKWVIASRHSALTNREIAAYVGEAHRLVAMKLTRRQRAELGLDAVIAAGRDRS